MSEKRMMTFETQSHALYEEAWLLRETDSRYLEDVEIPYRQEAVRHAQTMLEIAQARMVLLRRRQDDDCSTLPNT